MADVPFRALVCDMDGTLYEGSDEIDHYAELVREAVAPERRDAFWADWLLAREGRHRVRVGTTYRDPEGIEVAIGDAWWLAPTLARERGVSWETLDAAFRETRRYMASPHYRPVQIDGLPELLKALRERGVHLTLATNTPSETGKPFLDGLGLALFFDECHFGADKPDGLIPVIEKLRHDHGWTYGEIACVGDNWRNDVEPAVALGCPGMFIDRHGVKAESAVAPKAPVDRRLPPISVHASPDAWVKWLAARMTPL